MYNSYIHHVYTIYNIIGHQIENLKYNIYIIIIYNINIIYNYNIYIYTNYYIYIIYYSNYRANSTPGKGGRGVGFTLQ